MRQQTTVVVETENIIELFIISNNNNRIFSIAESLPLSKNFRELSLKLKSNVITAVRSGYRA